MHVQNFAPAAKWLERIARVSLSAACNRKQLLARKVVKEVRREKNETKMKQAQQINEQEFENQVLRSPQPSLVGFLVGWSRPCKLIEPILDEVADACDGTAGVFKVNVDDNLDLGTSYRIQSVPTLIYFVNGTIRAKIIGMASSKAILAKLNPSAGGNTNGITL